MFYWLQRNYAPSFWENEAAQHLTLCAAKWDYRVQGVAVKIGGPPRGKSIKCRGLAGGRGSRPGAWIYSRTEYGFTH